MIIEEGTYKARADAAGLDFGLSSNNNDQIKVPFRILDKGESFGKTILWIVAVTAETKSADTAKIGLIAAGWDGTSENFAGLGEIDCEIVIVHDTYQGKTNARVRYVNKLGGGFSFKQPLSYEQKIRLIDRLTGGQRREVPPAQSTGSEWDGQGADPNASDDDLPF